MTDINDIMPKIPSMKWGALMNRAPTNGKVKELNRIFPHNGKWHTVFEEKNHTYIDDKLVWKKDKKISPTNLPLAPKLKEVILFPWGFGDLFKKRFGLTS